MCQKLPTTYFHSRSIFRNPHQSGKLGQGLENLEKFLLKTGTEGFAVGDKITIADVHLYASLTFLGSGFFDGIPADYTKRYVPYLNYYSI